MCIFAGYSNCMYSPMPMWSMMPFSGHNHCGLRMMSGFNYGFGYAVGSSAVGLLGAVLNRFI